MGLVHDDQVVIRDRGHRTGIVIEDTFDKTLHRCHMDFGFLVDIFIIQILDVIDFIKSHQVFDFYFLKHVLCLLAKRGAVNKEQNPFEASAF